MADPRRQTGIDDVLAAKGYQQLTSISATTALTVPGGSTVAMIQAEAQAVRWRDDGTNPTASVGMNLAAGQTMWYTGPLASIKFIQVTSGAIVNVSYYGVS